MVDTIPAKYYDLGADSRAGNTIFFRSNERNLHLLINHVRHQTGSIFGVGSDQVLDIFAHTSATSGYLFDCSKPTTLLMRALLETGCRLRKNLGRNPSTSEFVARFLPEKHVELENELRDCMEIEEVIVTLDLIQPRPKLIETDNPILMGYSDFMKFRATLIDQSGETYAWYATPEKIEKVLGGYETDKIKILCGDLYKTDDIDFVSELIKAGGIGLDILYLSNLEDYLAKCQGVSKRPLLCELWDNLYRLPLSPRSVILRTTSQKLKREPEPDFDQTEQWHYNIETYRHHLMKTKRDPKYKDQGWIECAYMKQLQTQPEIPYVSYLK